MALENHHARKPGLLVPSLRRRARVDLPLGAKAGVSKNTYHGDGPADAAVGGTFRHGIRSPGTSFIYEIPEETFLKPSEELPRLEIQDPLQSPGEEIAARPEDESGVGARSHRPRLLLLDELTIGLDVLMQQSLGSSVPTTSANGHGAT